MRRTFVACALSLIISSVGFADVAYVANNNFGNPYIVEVDLDSSALSVLTTNQPAYTGPTMGTIYSLEIEDNDSLLLYCNDSSDADTEQLLRVDRITGNRTVVSTDSPSSPVGTGADFTPVGLGTFDIDMSTNGNLILDNYADSILEIDLSNGDRSTITSYTGQPFLLTDFLEEASDDLAVLNNVDGLVRVNRTTGARTTVVAALSLPAGFGYPLAEASTTEFYYIDTSSDELRGYDFISDTDTLVSGTASPFIDSPIDIQVGPSGNVYVLTEDSTLVEIDPGTGARTLILDTSAVSPPNFPTNDFAPFDMAIGTDATSVSDWQLY